MQFFGCPAGPCFNNDRREIGSNNNSRQFQCDDDSGEFEPQQYNNRQHWCVFPRNGTEIPGTRRDRSNGLNCVKRGRVVNKHIIYTHPGCMQYFRIAG